ncbi:MAG: HlyD family efflux transporter periplasmic adaptor subunit [Verrucomicrobiota bacterium]
MSKLTPNIQQYKKHHPLFRRLMGGWSFLVWVAMIGVTYLCYLHGGSFLPLNGQVRVIKENVSSTETARMSKILVRQGQEVQRGDVIAMLDTAMIDLKIRDLDAKLRHDRQLEALEDLDRQHRLLEEVQGLRKIISETELLFESDKSSNAVLTERYKAWAVFLKKGLVSDTEYFKVGVELAALEPKLKKYPEILAQYQKDLADAQRLQQETNAASVALRAQTEGQTLDASIENDPLMKELRSIRENHTLRAASAGSIWLINFQEGEVVAAGATVVEIIKHVAPTVEAFVPETLTIQVTVGQEFRVSTLTAPNQYYRATLTAITPQVVGQIDKANIMVNRVIRGRRLLLTPIEKSTLLPGESVMIEQLPKPWF